MPQNLTTIDSIIFFDTETTSPNPETTRVVQIAAIEHTQEGENILLNTLCDPEEPIDPKASAVHGIYDADVKGKGQDKLYCAQLVSYVQNLSAQGARSVLCGHNINTFDVPIIKRLGYAKHDCEFETLDTLKMARRLYQDAESHKLGQLHETLGLGSSENAHDAMADIRMVIALVDKMILDSGKNLEQMVEFLKEPFIFEKVGFGKHKGRKWGEAGLYRYARWCWENLKDPDILNTLKHHYKFK